MKTLLVASLFFASSFAHAYGDKGRCVAYEIPYQPICEAHPYKAACETHSGICKWLSMNTLNFTSDDSETEVEGDILKQ